MSYLVANLPPIQCYVRKEFLYDFQKGHGEYEPCYWVSVKSIKGKALYIESYLTNYGACYDKLPISAYVWKTDVNENELLPLDFLEIWDAFSYNITVIKKELLFGMDAKVYMKDKKFYNGVYMFTIDSCHSEPNELNTTLSETPNEHKSFNIIKLDNGQFAAQPNNRVLFYDQSLTPSGLRIPDFKVSTKEFYCEDSTKWSVGDEDNFFYDIKKNDLPE
jgi:hypothetical protein